MALGGKGCTNLILLIPQVVMYAASHGSTGAFSLLVSWFILAEAGKILEVNSRLRANEIIPHLETDTPVVSHTPVGGCLKYKSNE